jgi:hypothetical protein
MRALAGLLGVLESFMIRSTATTRTPVREFLGAVAAQSPVRDPA